MIGFSVETLPSLFRAGRGPGKGWFFKFAAFISILLRIGFPGSENGKRVPADTFNSVANGALKKFMNHFFFFGALINKYFTSRKNKMIRIRSIGKQFRLKFSPHLPPRFFFGERLKSKMVLNSPEKNIFFCVFSSTDEFLMEEKFKKKMNRIS